MLGQLRILLRHVAYPALLVTLVATAIAALHLRWDLGRVSQLFLVGTLADMAPLEWLIPYERAGAPSAREWSLYGLYFALTTIGGVLAQLPVATIVRWAAPQHPALPLQVEIPPALLLGSLANYLIHRWCHTNPRLRRLHGVHHAPDKVNVGDNGINHLLDIVLTQGYFVHANIDVRIGALNHVLAGPEQHRLHHSINLVASHLQAWRRPARADNSPTGSAG